MSDWKPIETAPKDGTPIQAEIPGHGSDNIIGWSLGFLDIEENQVGGWCFLEDQEPPECWTDGVCWESNENGTQSVQPIRWKHLPNRAAL